MNLYLLRHGEAEPHAHNDAARQLTPRGRADVAHIAGEFAKRGLPLNQCLFSPYLRARQTAELFLDNLAVKCPCISTEILVPDMRASKVMDFLNKNIHAQNVILVSHNPLLSELSALLTEGTINDMQILSTSELVCISLEVIGPGVGTMPFRLTPPVHRLFS